MQSFSLNNNVADQCTYGDIFSKSQIKNFIIYINENDRESISFLKSLPGYNDKNLILIKNTLTFDCHNLAKNSSIIALNKIDNYYSLFFKILKITFPGENLEEFIHEFQSYCKEKKEGNNTTPSNIKTFRSSSLYRKAREPWLLAVNFYSFFKNKIVTLFLKTAYKKSFIFFMLLLILPPVFIPVVFKSSYFSLKDLGITSEKNRSIL